MDEKELRIGNITKQGIVKCFYENGIHVGFGKCFDFQDVEPCPITEELLSELGWGKGDFDTQYIDNTSFATGVLYYTVNPNILCIELDRDSIELNHIKYAHQLQNLVFSLTGKELTIKSKTHGKET